MGTLLFFDMDEVRALYEHSKASDTHMMTYGQDREAVTERQDGLVRLVTDTAHADSADQAEALYGAPHLWLAKDDGVYLMSPGVPALMDAENPERRRVAYARGYRPNPDLRFDGAVWDRAHELSGDDFTELVELGWVEIALEEGLDEFVLSFDHDQVALMMPAPAAAPADAGPAR